MRRLLQLVRFVRIALAARTIQDFLWGGAPGHRTAHAENLPNYLDALQKRIDCLRQLDRAKRSWRVEGRKRLLQLAAVSVATMEYLDGGNDA